MSNAVAETERIESQSLLDEANSRFWNELCGTNLAQSLGLVDHSAEFLRRFDDAYFDMYPYLLPAVRPEEMACKSVLEIGLGYGSLSQKIAEAGADFVGMDIAAGPVQMVNDRLRIGGLPGRAICGNALAMPFDNESMDFLVSIGCFHHTGNVQRCLDETHRVLKPGGVCVIMLYNKFSYRQWRRRPLATLREFGRDRFGRDRRLDVDQLRGEYDAHVSGEAAPEVTLHSKRELRRRFGRFREVTIQKQNFDPLIINRYVYIRRERLLSTLGRTLGLDLYVRAVK